MLELKLLLLGIGAALVALITDRLLLAAEARGWIHYRRNGFARPGSIYHLNELSETFGAGKLPAIEEHVRQDESGDPLRRRDEE